MRFLLFGVIGGDRRQAELARLLRADGHAVAVCGHGERGGAAAYLSDAAILPLPLCAQEGQIQIGEKLTAAEEVFRRFPRGQIVLAGNVAPAQRREAEAAGIRLIDYFEREELTVANAAATAEATVQVLMEHLDRVLRGAECLILGCGRIGKFLAMELLALGARVTVAARKRADLAWARGSGASALAFDALDGRLAAFDAVINTVPAPVMGSALLAQLPPRCLCVDVASVQGIDLMTAQTMGHDAVWARGLPGRLVPRTAAEIIRDTVCQILREEGILE